MTHIFSDSLIGLLEQLQTTFSKSSKDRKRLHNQEWEAGEGSPAILGEIEVRADTAIGIARRCLTGKPDSRDKLADLLEESCVYRSEILANWLAKEGSAFPDFFHYIMVVENLRACTVLFLKQDKTKVP